MSFCPHPSPGSQVEPAIVHALPAFWSAEQDASPESKPAYDVSTRQTGSPHVIIHESGPLPSAVDPESTFVPPPTPVPLPESDAQVMPRPQPAVPVLLDPALPPLPTAA